jgi:hypothetical protein
VNNINNSNHNINNISINSSLNSSFNTVNNNNIHNINTSMITMKEQPSLSLRKTRDYPLFTGEIKNFDSTSRILSVRHDNIHRPMIENNSNISSYSSTFFKYNIYFN